jgi:hypothetical protein
MLLAGAYFGANFGEALFESVYDVLFIHVVSPLASLFRDPLIIDLDGDGIELTALGVAGEAGASNVFFDYDGDGFAERTGWVKPDDGILVYDRNGNGQVDDAGELFGSPNQDGYAVLETLDSNGDGAIDAADAAFADLEASLGEVDRQNMNITDMGSSSIALSWRWAASYDALRRGHPPHQFISPQDCAATQRLAQAAHNPIKI